MMHAAPILILALVWLAAIGVTPAGAQIVWQIGTPNHDYRDLAFEGDVNAYAKAFPNDVTFVVGQSDPKKDFSGIQPGPSDPWAGRREHPFTIEFTLPATPTTPHALRIDLVDVHADRPPALHVDVNGQSVDVALPRGGGDISLLRPEKGRAHSVSLVLPSDLLKAGANRIVLRGRNGSWILYDAVTLEALASEAAAKVELTVTPTIFFVERDGRLLQEFTISASGLPGAESAQLAVRSGADTIATMKLGKPTLGILTAAAHVPATDAPRELQFALSSGGASAQQTAQQAPKRKWRIYCAPATHTDIGYTDLQANVIALHNRNTDLALELVAQFPLYHWNLESAWAGQMWLRDRPGYRHDDLYRAAKDHRIGIESSYLNMLTGLCSDEELIRNLYYAARLQRLHGVPFESHTITDAPSHVWSVPTILAGAGIHCVSVGVNQTRAPLFRKGIHHKSPFWWEGPDGSRVLTWFSDGYSQAGRIGLSDGLDRMRSAIEADLAWWDRRDDYPYDAILLHGAYSDNVAIGRGMAESLAEYAQRYAYPKVILCANNDFFEYIEKNFADKIPTVRGDGGSWWEDGAGSSAVETGINRVTHQDVIAAEAVWAVAPARKADAERSIQQDFDDVWDNILLYDEHTWGAHNSIADPTSDFVQRQWAVKAAYATFAADRTNRLLDRGLRRLAARVGAPDGSVLVFNPSGRARTGVVEVAVPRGTRLFDGDKPVPQQVVREDVLRDRVVAFLASDVPAVGYKTYRVGPDGGALPDAAGRFDGNVLENDFYRVEFDAQTGGIASLIDKKSNRQLVDTTSPYKLGQVIYAAGGEERAGQTQVMCPNPSKIKYTAATGDKLAPGVSGPLRTSAKSSMHLPRFSTLEMETILVPYEPRIDFVFRMDKQLTFEKEAVYIAFPIAGANPHFRYEIGAGSVRPNEDHIPGACRDWFAVQRWVTVATDAGAVAWTPVDTPLITLCDLTPGKWLEELPITNGTIFAYVMNNYWFTNYKAGQNGWMTYRYSLTSDAAIDPSAACRFGESVVAPMRAVRLHENRGTPTLPASRSFCRVEPDNVMLTTIKQADDGKGVIVRLRETGGKATDAKITATLTGLASAARCDLVERSQEALPIVDGAVTVHVPANGLATVRLD